jgi:hypothetical protein
MIPHNSVAKSDEVKCSFIGKRSKVELYFVAEERQIIALKQRRFFSVIDWSLCS